jgi:hypothetical protein
VLEIVNPGISERLQLSRAPGFIDRAGDGYRAVFITAMKPSAEWVCSLSADGQISEDGHLQLSHNLHSATVRFVIS